MRQEPGMPFGLGYLVYVAYSMETGWISENDSGSCALITNYKLILCNSLTTFFPGVSTSSQPCFPGFYSWLWQQAQDWSFEKIGIE